MPRGNQFLSGAMPGLSRLAQAFAGGQGAHDDAYNQQMGLQSRMAQALAAARASDANAEESLAKADFERRKGGVLEGRPALVEELIAGNAGTDAPMVRAIRQTIQTGQRPQVPMGPPTEAGDLGVGSQQFDPQVQSRVAQQLQRLAPALLSSGDIKVDDWAKALGGYQDMDQESAAAAGLFPVEKLAQLRYAAKGSAPYHFDSSGLVGNNLTGKLDESSGRAQSVTGKEVALGRQATAGAAENYAQAAAANASAAKTKAEMEQGIKTGALQVVTGEDGISRVINKATGKAQTVIDAATGQPLAAAGKPLPEAAQKQVTGARNLQDAVGGYLDVLKGWSNQKMLSPDERAAMGNAYNNMMLQAKEAYNLGVLNGPDYEILQSVVKDPTKLSSVAVSNEALGAQAKSLRDIAANIERTSLESHGRKYTPRQPPAAASPAPAGPARVNSDADYNALPPGATFVGPDGKTRRKP